VNPLNWMLSGAVAMASFAAGVFFLRFWRHTRDRFFLYFVACFWLEGASRIFATVFLYTHEDEPLLYGVRLLAYALIIVAIWQKNRPRGD
jgi:hypothetical protein